MADAPQKLSIFQEVGGTGLNFQRTGVLQEEFQTELRGLSGVRIYTEMATHAVVGAILFVIEQMIAQVEWKFEPASESPADQEPADFAQECLEDMNKSWIDTLSEICTMFTYGWAYLETVYKIRRGFDSAGDMPRSKFDDGKIGWRKWALRGQDTLYAWEFDDSGGIQGMTQQLILPQYQKITIPIDKALLFRTRVEKDSPEGRSILRQAYVDWYYAKRFREIEAIGVERDLAGLPVLTPPEDLDLWNSKDPQMITALNAAKQTVQSIKRGEKEGIVKPFGWTLELLASASRRNFDLSAIINRNDTRIAQSCLADFIFLGQGKQGSWALSSDKTDMFILALAAYLKRIKEVVNRYAIPTLFKLNGMSLDNLPHLEHGDIETQNLQELAQYLTALSTVGAVTFPDDALSRHLRKIADFPEPPDEPLPPADMIQTPIRQQVMNQPEVQKKLSELREVMQAAKAKNLNGHAN